MIGQLLEGHVQGTQILHSIWTMYSNFFRNIFKAFFATFQSGYESIQTDFSELIRVNPDLSEFVLGLHPNMLKLEILKLIQCHRFELSVKS